MGMEVESPRKVLKSRDLCRKLKTGGSNPDENHIYPCDWSMEYGQFKIIFMGKQTNQNNQSHVIQKLIQP